MRASRLLSMLMLLQTRGRLSARVLAEELSVSQRTVLRDIDHLSAAGVPVWSDRGRQGGFQLREGWRTQLTGLTEPEAQALFLAGLPGPAAELGLAGDVASARLKVLATLPPPWREDALRVSSRLHLDPSDWFRAQARTDCLALAADAVWRQRRVAMRYDSWQGRSDREAEPLGLVLKAGVWYLVARADAAAAPRIFRLSSVVTMRVLDDGFAYPDGFDLAACWRAAADRFEAEVYRDWATLLVSPRGLRGLQQFSAAVAEAASTSARPEPGRRGWVRVRVPIESVDHAAGQVLRLGVEAEVMAPLALRARLSEIAAVLAQRYALPPAP